jgi:predicted ribonuclease YlaK
LYTGVEELTFNDEELAQFYEGKYQQNFYRNQYVLIKNIDGDIVDKLRYDGEKLVPIKYSKISGDFFGKFTPRSERQELAFDLLQNNSITGKLLVGGFGSGKTIISLVHAYNFISGRNAQFDKIIYLRNNISVKNTVDLGALPNGKNEKLLPWAMPLADILGEETQLNYLVESGKLQLEHLGFIRGRSYKNSVVFLSEAQNLTKELMSIVVSRIGEGSILIVEGDSNQCDKSIFEHDNGIYSLSEALKGDMEFGMVTLKKNERSRFASLSDKILQI